MKRILVVDGDMTVRAQIGRYARLEGYDVAEASDGYTAVALCRQSTFDFVILAVMLPELDGFSVCQTIRSFSQVPILILSERGDEADRIRGLELGADDYVVKPFGVPELLARIRTTLRRADRINLSQGEQKDRYQVKDLVVDTARHQVFVGSEEIHFTQNEFKILELLCLHAGKVLTYDFILKHVWGPYEGSNNQILRVNMANIRRKLKENPSEPKYILTELGIGYRMLEDS